MPNLFAFFQEQVLTDFTLVSGKFGEEISVHKSIIAASIPAIKQHLICHPGTDQFSINVSSTVLHAIVALCYDAPLPEISCTEIYQFVAISRSLGISDHLLCDLQIVRLPDLILHQESEISQIDQNTFIEMLYNTCETFDSAEASLVVEFARKLFSVEHFSDLLRIGKLRIFPTTANFFVEGKEVYGTLNFVSLAHNSVIQVRADKFDWILRIDYPDNSRFRVVYEGATSEEESEIPVLKFPSALFEWSVDEGERETFVCFPTETRLQWSTTFSRVPKLLNLKISELPLNSLVLWYIARHMSELLASEDVFNKLGNVEFRAVSAFIMQQNFGFSSKADLSVISARD